MYVGYRSECMVMSYGNIVFPCVARCCCIEVEIVMDSVIQKSRELSCPTLVRVGTSTTLLPVKTVAPEDQLPVPGEHHSLVSRRRSAHKSDLAT